MTFSRKQIRETMAEVGRKGGQSRSPALTAARQANGRCGGRKPSPEVIAWAEKVADAVAKAAGNDRAFLLEAFKRLAPESVYQARWRAEWGPTLTAADRRPLRGWGPPHRIRAGNVADRVLRA